MKPVPYIVTLLLILSMATSCTSDVTVPDRDAEEKKVENVTNNDVDGDGILNEEDNCPTIFNEDQDPLACEDLDCASNFCQDGNHLSGYHCDGGSSVQCGTRSGGCLFEFFREDCSSDCSSSDGLCKPEPGDPIINSVNGTVRDGEIVSIDGLNFGTNSLDMADSGVGSNGFIERNNVGDFLVNTGNYGTLNDVLSPDWGRGYTSSDLYPNAARITDVIAITGKKSLDCSNGNYSGPRLGTTTNSLARQVTYNRPGDGSEGTSPDPAKQSQFTEFYMSWWWWMDKVYFNFDPEVPQVHQGGMKLWWVSSENHHAHAGSVNMTGGCALTDANPLCNGIGWQAFGAADEWYYPDGSPGGYPSFFRGATYQTWESEESFPTQHESTSGNFIPDTRNNVHMADRQWIRYEIRGRINSLLPDQTSAYDGEMDIWTTVPGRGQARTLIAKARNVSFRDINGTRTDKPGILPTDAWRQVSIQNFVYDGSNNAWDIFVDDVYLQFGTQARLEVGNNPVYDACTKLFVQVPTNWNKNGQSITAELNLSGFELEDPLYLFVINGAGKVSPGKAITLE